MAGYGVECILKALLLSTIPVAYQKDQMEQFKGRIGHDFGWLKGEYIKRGGAGMPKTVTRSFVTANTWNVDFRYEPKFIGSDDADIFLSAAKILIDWADTRI
jgi:hypothetical protein